jgi:uncharacterized protein (DUF1501 family)
MQVGRPEHKANGGEENSKLNNNSISRGTQGGKRVLYHIPSLEAADHVAADVSETEEGKDVESEDDEELADLMDDSPDVEMLTSEARNLIAQTQARMMAAISEASTPSRRAKRRADTAHQASLERAEKIKAAQNLDATPIKGNTEISEKSFLHFTS